MAEDGVRCKECMISFSSKHDYQVHSQGMLHRLRAAERQDGVDRVQRFMSRVRRLPRRPRRPIPIHARNNHEGSNAIIVFNKPGENTQNVGRNYNKHNDDEESSYKHCAQTSVTEFKQKQRRHANKQCLDLRHHLQSRRRGQTSPYSEVSFGAKKSRDIGEKTRDMGKNTRDMGKNTREMGKNTREMGLIIETSYKSSEECEDGCPEPYLRMVRTSDRPPPQAPPTCMRDYNRQPSMHCV